MTLRYPSDGYAGDADYVSFRHMKYTSRGSMGGGGGGGGYITLYMPENLPNIGNGNAWEQFSFGAGPIGKLIEGAADEVIAFSNVNPMEGMKKENFNKGVDRVRKMFDNLADSAGPAGRQALLEGAASTIGASANQVLSVRTGQIYNPNIELAYNGPAFREFAFQFRMVPKSAGEAAALNSIIREFKRWSAPEVIQGGMYEIPHVWQIDFMSGGGRNAFQNQFKPAALLSVNVQDNAGVGYYSAHQGGAAIETSLTLSFKEVDVITRQDHTGLRGM